MGLSIDLHSREQMVLSIESSYVDAFREIEADPNNEVVVAEIDGAIIGTLQLTFTPSLSFQAGRRLTVVSVRVDAKFRGAEPFVCEDTKEQHYNQEKSKIRGFEIIKVNFDDSFKTLSPGTYLNFRMLEELFGGGDHSRYYMGPGNNPYKSRWSEAGEPVQTLTSYSPTVRGRAGALWSEVKPRLKTWRDRLAP